jgi:hypothetical protein
LQTTGLRDDTQEVGELRITGQLWRGRASSSDDSPPTRPEEHQQSRFYRRK